MVGVLENHVYFKIVEHVDSPLALYMALLSPFGVVGDGVLVQSVLEVKDLKDVWVVVLLLDVLEVVFGRIIVVFVLEVKQLLGVLVLLNQMLKH